MKTLTLLILLFIPLLAQDPVIYTIEGKKDPRLDAVYRVLYVSTGTSEECTTRKLSTGTKKPAIGSKTYAIKDENYSIKIPIALEEDENNCGYRFERIELIMRRLYDDDLYSLHMILNKKPEAEAIYYGRKGGFGGQASLIMPGKLLTDKTYYRIAENTRFLCRTNWYPAKYSDEAGKLELHRFYKRKGLPETLGDESTDFHCIMQIGDGAGVNAFIYPDPHISYAKNSALGVDTLKNETLHVDIIADDEGSRAILKGLPKDYFRTLPKPAPSSFESLKSLF
ncbi:MAG: hypothetical protein AB7S65_13150 [Sulfuricurvum sp.]